MAYLPSIAVGTAIKLDPDFRKLPSNDVHSLPTTDNKVETGLEHSQCLDCRDQELGSIRVGSRVESAFYVPLFQDCIKRASLSQSRAVHAHVIKSGFSDDLFVATSLVNVYAKCVTMGDARKLFDSLPRRNVVSWTSLMTGYIQNSQPELAATVFLELLESGAYPTNFTLGAVLSACSALNSIELGKQLHGYAIKYDIVSDTSLGNSLCNAYCKGGRLEDAIKIFRSMPEKNVISWTAIISGCKGNDEAHTGMKLFIEMLSNGVEPNELTLTSVLSLCCTMLDLTLGEQVFSLSTKLGCISSVPFRNSAMYLYLKCGKIDEAKKFFEKMETVTAITWNAMISGLAQMMDQTGDSLLAQYRGLEALRMFQSMNRSTAKPDSFTFSSVLTICSRLGNLEQGEQLHAQTIKTGVLSDIVVGSSLVNMYNKCGNLKNATKAFFEMPVRTLISWTSMITGYAQNGMPQEALQLFEDMILAGVRPNQVTFVGLLSACSHAAKLEEARNYFNLMINEYRIKPVMDHYACLIGMFVRLGQLEEAFQITKEMEFEPNELIWSMLIAGCRSHGNMELAFYAADRLLDLKPKDAETYVLLLNMYLSAKRFKDVTRVRKLMKEENIKKLKDESWIGIKGKIYDFDPSDRLNSKNEKMCELLTELHERAKSLGYSYDKQLQSADEEDGEMNSSVYHSEKLAVAFGLLNTHEGSTIQVVKSIGMCRDCHSAIKLFSKMTNREIIVRDSKSLHRFKDGSCSCGDFASLL